MGAATWKPALVYAQVFDDEMHRFSITATRELQNTSTYINAYDTAELNAR
jgi:excinuclease UvrABC nuclease subunit